MSLGEVIQMEVDGVVVEGRARINPCDLAVEITKPFGQLSERYHIRGMARMARPFDGDRGQEKAKEELELLYRLGSFLQDQLLELQAAYVTMLNRIEDALDDFRINDFAAKRALLKMSFKAGEMGQQEYQKQLGVLREWKSGFDTRAREIKNDFFETEFSMTVPYQAREKISQVLNEPYLLFSEITQEPERRNAYEKTFGKFENVELGAGEELLIKKLIRLDGSDAMYQRWSWDGMYGESVFFLTVEVAGLSDKRLIDLVQRFTKKDDLVRIRRAQQGYDVLSFNFGMTDELN